MRSCENRPATQAGFTLLETLIALILVVVVVAAALESQVVTLKLEQAARDAHHLRHAVGHVMVQSLLQHEKLESNSFYDADARITITVIPDTEPETAHEHFNRWVIAKPQRQIELWMHAPVP